MARRKRRRQYGTGSVQVRGRRHIVQWYEAGKRRTRSFKDAVSAGEFLTNLTSSNRSEAVTHSTQTLSKLASRWLDSRAAMASSYDNRCRWRAHLEPIVGHLQPSDVTVPILKEAIAMLRAKGLAGSTVSLCLKLLSSLYGELVEEGLASLNPVRLLSKKTRVRELRSGHDPKNTPYVKIEHNVSMIYRNLNFRNPAVALAYAVGALAGLRTSEVRALDWGRDVDLVARTITVRQQVNRRGDGTKPTKDKDGRVVLISDSLYAILVANTPASGLVAKGWGGFLSDDTMRSELKQTLDVLGLRAECACCGRQMTWYGATRHTWASLWVKNGGSLEQAKAILGHSSVALTERYYVHLVPGRFSDADRSRVSVESEPLTEARPN